MCAKRQTAEETILYKTVVPTLSDRLIEIGALPATALFDTGKRLQI